VVSPTLAYQYRHITGRLCDSATARLCAFVCSSWSSHSVKQKNYCFLKSGDGPASYFWADTNSNPSDKGVRLLDIEPLGSCGTTPLIEADGNATYRIEFPEGMTITDYLGGCK
jgi:hypothetical protein